MVAAVDAEAADAVEARLQALGAAAVSIEPDNSDDVLEPAPGAAPLWSAVKVCALFDAQACSREALAAHAGAALAGEAVRTLTVQPLDEQDWMHAWRREAVASEFGEGLWVLPHDAPEPPRARAVVRLEPGLAFGTGGHPTTALCLAWLAEQPLQGATVLDLGCGSGVLAIAAAALGATRVVAVDNDPQALTATRENARRNAVATQIEVAASVPAMAADVVVANILANALHELEPVVADSVRRGGRAALSGILPQQTGPLSALYASHFEVEPHRERDGWALLSLLRA